MRWRSPSRPKLSAANAARDRRRDGRISTIADRRPAMQRECHSGQFSRDHSRPFTPVMHGPHGPL